MYVEFLTLAIFALIIFYSAKSRNIENKTKEELVEGKENRIKEIRFKDRLYDVTDWINRHPGGKIIEFYTSNDEDASIAIQQFHNRSAKKVLAILNSFKSRPVPEKTGVSKKDLKYQELTEDFHKLFKELQDEGLFEPSLVYAVLRISEIICLGVLGMTLILQSESIGWLAVGILLASVFQMRAGFFMHEAGHCQITGWPKADRAITSIFFGVGMGLSGSWWRNQHNKHHAMPQRLDHDVDLKTLPAVAFNAKVVKGKINVHNFWIQNQKKFLVPFASTLGQMSWKIHLHPLYTIRKTEFLDLLTIGIHFYGAYKMGFINYMLVHAIESSAMLITFSLSHSHTPVTEEPSHWVEYCTIHTINVNPSWWCDYWMGYLNYQIEHHMFPTLPQFRLRSISGRVKALVQKHDLPYTCDSYGTAFGKLFRNLSAVSKELDEQAKLVGHIGFLRGFDWSLFVRGIVNN